MNAVYIQIAKYKNIHEATEKKYKISFMMTSSITITDVSCT